MSTIHGITKGRIILGLLNVVLLTSALPTFAADRTLPHGPLTRLEFEMDKAVVSGTPGDKSGELGDAAAGSDRYDVLRYDLDLKIELGRTHMYLEDVLKLRKGSVVPLDKLAGDPVDIYVNGRLIARGEVLVLNDNFCVRVAELIVGENVGA